MRRTALLLLLVPASLLGGAAGDALSGGPGRAGLGGQDGTRAALRITVWPEGREAGDSTVRTLRCAPPGGTLPRPTAACRRLAALERSFAPVPPDSACIQIYGGPQEALVTGVVEGRRVWARFSRVDGCQIERWRRHAFLFAA
jgi:hypothetical protein